MDKIPITVAHGDGIGPEIMTAVLKVLEAAKAPIEPTVIEIGESIYKKGFSAGIEPKSWDTLRKTKVFLKAPITTPQGGGFKSLNVTIRKTLGLYANVRPCVSYNPFIATKHPKMDVVIIRENEEDLYAGIEHRQTPEVVQCLKLVSIPGCEKIIRYAFEYAKKNNRKKVTCFTKDNIMKLTDGLFHKIFEQIATDYPEITNEHWIVDIGAAKLADKPEQFDVIVTMNLYGDILSDVAAQIAGSVGLAGSANIGAHCAMFEAIHGSAPRVAGKNMANPSGLLMAAVMMLVHISQPEIAETIHNAWLVTLEDGIHTYDIFHPAHSKEKVGTQEFAAALIARLGRKPEYLIPVAYAKGDGRILQHKRLNDYKEINRLLKGADVFLYWDPPSDDGSEVEKLAAKLKLAGGEKFDLSLITNRGVKIWPHGIPETLCTDHWRARFKATTDITLEDIALLLQSIYNQGCDFIKVENLYDFNGEPGYSMGQGE